jgi:Flp pilus assembly protein CpaB
MKAKAYVPLVVGLIVGVLAIKLTFDYVRKARGSSFTGPGITVVRARANIPMAAEITNDMVDLVQVPKTFVPADAFNKKEDVVGRVTCTIIPKDLPVTGSLLAPKGTTPGIEARIPKGYRAVAVKIDESSGVAFLVKPGSRVDVVAVMTSQGGRDAETVSKTILENIEVAAVGQELGHNTDKGAVATKSITLLLKPEDVPTLHLAAQKGKILLAMRNQVDMSSRPIAGTTEKKLLGRESADAKGGLFSKLFGDGKPASTKPRPTVKAPVLAVVPQKPAKEWPVELISGSQKGDTELVRAEFDGPEALRRSGPGGLSGSSRTPGLMRGRPSGPSGQNGQSSASAMALPQAAERDADRTEDKSRPE